MLVLRIYGSVSCLRGGVILVPGFSGVNLEETGMSKFISLCMFAIVSFSLVSCGACEGDKNKDKKCRKKGCRTKPKSQVEQLL
ncbi:MAG: hypothetical protein S4CHLAM102_10250 [Chlamydiia bacterium]|nr:hypothetical protein [Chlamydiia bacterium]